MRIPYTPPGERKIPATGLSPVLWTSFGAHRKYDILPMDFRSSPENGHSRYGNRTARFAPKLPSASVFEIVSVGWKGDLQRGHTNSPNCARGLPLTIRCPAS